MTRACPAGDVRTREILREIATSVRVLSDTTYSSDGFLRGVTTTGPRSRSLATELRDHLYRRFYLHDRSQSGPYPDDTAGSDRRPVFAREDHAFVQRIFEACGPRYAWADGWTLVEPRNENVSVVAKDGLYLRCTSEEVAFTGPGAETVSVRFPLERPFVSPGFYLASGQAGEPLSTEAVARWYVAVRPEGAAEVFSALVHGLDAGRVRYVVKVINDPALFYRPDAIVLYLPRSAAVGSLALLASLVSENGHVRDVTPAFTRRVLPGLAIADEPAGRRGATSFGRHRCEVLARGLLAAGCAASPHIRHQALLQALADEGLRIDALHLNPGAADFTLTSADGA